MHIFYIVPAGRVGIMTELPDYGANNGRSLLDGHMDTRGEPFSENHYRLDENGVEQLGTPHLIFLSPAEPIKGIGTIPVGKIDVFGPCIVCNSKYRGFTARQIPIAAVILQTIFLTSEGGDYNMRPKTLDEMLRENGSKS